MGVLALIAGAAALVAWRLGYFDLQGSALRTDVARVRATPWAGPLFVAAYAGITAVGVPPTPLTLLGGAVFGFTRGLLYNWIALLGGSAGGYAVARLVGGGVVQRLLRGHDDLLGQLRRHRGFMAVLRMQLLPFIPSVVANYAAGSARIPFLSFVGATALGIVPITAAYTYVAQQVVAGVSGAGRHALIVAAAMATVTVGASYAPAIAAQLRRRV
ncbi:MAG TPA: VTT domain-containing protein [Gemmatimonadaceae bacterium]|nr:VTT domain-containing protein [Gemmatimonadaceae bacterium]